MTPAEPATAAVLVPVKAFGAAKARLGDVLAPEARADLARAMAAVVLAAAAPLPVFVVCDDDEVEAFAVARGASVIRQVRPGLNAAVTDGVAHLAALGVDRAVVAHADLPEAGSFAHVLAAGSGVVVVPDRHEGGTNVLVVPTAAGFTFAYGPGSFAAHVAEARRLGLDVVVVRDESLAWDVDTAGDLRATTSSPPATSPGAPPRA